MCAKSELIKPTTVVNVRKDSHDVYIGRGSKWGNPFKMRTNLEEERNLVCNQYEEWFYTQPDLVRDIRELKGKILGCYCKPKRCHGDFLAKLANELE